MIIHTLINRSVLSTCRCSSIIYQRHFASKITENLETKVNDMKIQREKIVEDLIENFEPIYRFPKIKSLAAINRLKTYQGIISALVLPITYFTYPEVIVEVSWSGISLFLVLSLFSYGLRNSIGAVYMNKKNNEEVRIAYVDFWGKRRDTLFKINDIVPIAPRSGKNNYLVKVAFNNDHEPLKFIAKEQVVLDQRKFNEVFGEY